MKCKYRVRWSSSKGAFLVLLWTLLTLFGVLPLFHNLSGDPPVPSFWVFSIPTLVALLSAPLSGWLADAKFGNYKIFRFGAVLLFISTVINSLLLILEVQVLESNQVLKWIHLTIGDTLFVVGVCACIVTALPLGLDQMPDVFSPKWLIIEPKSPQSLKTIYRVLKFAAKHKASLNRSALTYWEEDMPSRIDFSGVLRNDSIQNRCGTCISITIAVYDFLFYSEIVTMETWK